MREHQLRLIGGNYRTDERTLEVYEFMIGKPNRELARVLTHFDQTEGLGHLYYPGQGLHILPRDTLGVDRVTHLSLDTDYFELFGEGIKVQGDYRTSPFPDNSFGSTLVWGLTQPSIVEAIDDILRVTKENGLIVVGQSRYFADIIKDRLKRVASPVEEIDVFRNNCS